MFGCLIQGTPYDVHSAIVNTLVILPGDLRIATGGRTVSFFHVLYLLQQYKPTMGINVFFHRLSFDEWDDAQPRVQFRRKDEELERFWDAIIPGQRSVQVALTVPVPGGPTNVVTDWFCDVSTDSLVTAVAGMSFTEQA